MTAPTILVVDDDPKLCGLIAQLLEQHGFIVLTASNGIKARAIVHEQPVDAMVLDVMMPKEDGFQLAERLHLQGVTVPIIFLTAKSDAQDRIAGLQLGAQDYLCKPFEPMELVLRLKNCLKRQRSGAVTEGLEPLIHFGPWRYDLSQRRLTHEGTLVPLTDLEHHLLYGLAQYPNQPLSREKLAGTNLGTISDRTVDVQIARLRRKIESDPAQPLYIQTVRHKGYKLAVDSG